MPVGGKGNRRRSEAPVPLERGLHWKLHTRPQDQKGGGPHAVTQHKQRAHARHEQREVHTGYAGCSSSDGRQRKQATPPASTMRDPLRAQASGLSTPHPHHPESHSRRQERRHTAAKQQLLAHNTARLFAKVACVPHPRHGYPAATPAPVQLRHMRAPSARRLKKGCCQQQLGLQAPGWFYGENQVTQGPPRITDAAYMQYNFSSM